MKLFGKQIVNIVVGAISVSKVPETILQALTPPGNVGKKVPQTILLSLYTPFPYGQCPYGNNTFQKGASLKATTR